MKPQYTEYAFPIQFDDGSSHFGMTLRDYFAAQALQGILASGEHMMNVREYAERAYMLAGAMMNERET
jgi:hypothetical protein